MTDNYPPGAANDPKAPYNQEDPEKVECDECGGSGYLECEACGTHDAIECDKCHGEGSVEADYDEDGD